MKNVSLNMYLPSTKKSGGPQLLLEDWCVISTDDVWINHDCHFFFKRIFAIKVEIFTCIHSSAMVRSSSAPKTTFPYFHIHFIFNNFLSRFPQIDSLIYRFSN